MGDILQVLQTLPEDALAYGPPPARARVRATPEDFQVDEQLLEAPAGEGQHLLVQVRKRGANTEWVAKRLADAAGVRPAAVSYAGLKDRHAVTTQWFSIDLAGKPEPERAALGGEEYQVLAATRHTRKLRRGELAGNGFVLHLTELEGDIQGLIARCETFASTGVPNYFGAQRFGHGGDNLRHAAAMLEGRERPPRHLRGLYLSAARSFLFNRVLSARIEQGNWHETIPGEAPFYGGQGYRRGASGPLWGRGRSSASGQAGEVERAVLAPYGPLMSALEQVGLKQERRALVLPVDELHAEATARGLKLSFWLPTGAYATSVLRELVTLVDAPPGAGTLPESTA